MNIGGEDSPIPNTRGIRANIVDALRRIDIPNLRWPGGCYSDDYHSLDGIGPRDKRPKRINMRWGHLIDTSAFGTHEFLDLCEQLDCEPYLAGNVGSGTPQEVCDWIEYPTYVPADVYVICRTYRGKRSFDGTCCYKSSNYRVLVRQSF